MGSYNNIPPPPGYTLDQPPDKLVQVPGVGNVSFPGTMSDDAISGVIAQQHPELQAQQAQQQQPGFFKRLAQSFGIPTSGAALQAATPQNWQDVADLTNPGGIAKRLLTSYGQTAGQGIKEGYQEAKEAGANISAGQPIMPNIGKAMYGGVHGGLSAVPVIGPTINTMGEDAAQNNWPGFAGGGTGVTAQILGPKLIGTAADAIPSKARAGGLFNEASAAAGDTPIDVSNPGNTALQIRDMAASGGRLPKVVRDFISRTTDPNQGPLTYDEARQFYQNAGQLAVNERNALNPSMQRMVGQFRQQLGQSIGQAADQAGVGPQYQGAMQEYRQFNTLQDFKNMLMQNVVKPAAKAAIPTAAGGYLLNKLLGALQGNQQR